MGARAPPSERPRRGGIKCEFCGRTVPSQEALRSHQNALHSQALKEKSKPKPTPGKTSKVQKPTPSKVTPQKPIKKVASKPSNTDGKKNSVATRNSKNTKEQVRNTDSKVSAVNKTEENKPMSLVDSMEKNITKELKNKMNGKNVSDARKTEFKCPKCDKLFGVLFAAQKHIQKSHSEDDDSTERTPIILEFCLHCNEKLPSPHDCPNKPEVEQDVAYNCVGCEQRFRSNKLFDVHIPMDHGEGVEALFFLKEEEFSAWKSIMEHDTRCTYVMMSRHNSKQLFRCTLATDETSDEVMDFCPSTIVSTQQANGYHVSFYPEHHGHDCKPYLLHDQFKSFSVPDLLEDRGADTDLTDDPYIQFKTLMENIVIDAAKINVTTLKVLIDKAAEMNSILNGYDEDDDTMNTDRSIISVVSPNDVRKRKTMDDEPVSNKRTKPTKKPITYSLADDRDTDKILKEWDRENKLKQTPTKDIENSCTNTNQSPSFNDSYKNFISSVTTKPVLRKSVKKKPVKTKIGQFKPSSPRRRRVKDFVYEVREQPDDCNILVLKI